MLLVLRGSNGFSHWGHAAGPLCRQISSRHLRHTANALVNYSPERILTWVHAVNNCIRILDKVFAARAHQGAQTFEFKNNLVLAFDSFAFQRHESSADNVPIAVWPFAVCEENWNYFHFSLYSNTNCPLSVLVYTRHLWGSTITLRLPPPVFQNPKWLCSCVQPRSNIWFPYLSFFYQE